MTILVTGATGFIGKKVVLKLAEKNIDIVAADIDLGTNKEVLLEEYKNKNYDLGRLTIEKLDITEQVDIDRIFDKYSFQAIIHLAYGIGLI